VKLSSPGPILFKQERVGFNRKRFKMLKFRSMVVNDRSDTAWSKNKDDRRTKFGSFIRRTSLDELPQLINVLKGEMSLVGPRPYLPREMEDMGKYYDTIILCRPGLTGMWQTHGRSEAPFPQRLRFDDYYYRNWSIWLDLTILSKTFKTVNSSTGAV
jgi:undecaprenyl-phosphate galactose phosphotransferase